MDHEKHTAITTQYNQSCKLRSRMTYSADSCVVNIFQRFNTLLACGRRPRLRAAKVLTYNTVFCTLRPGELPLPVSLHLNRQRASCDSAAALSPGFPPFPTPGNPLQPSNVSTSTGTPPPPFNPPFYARARMICQRRRSPYFGVPDNPVRWPH